ncbi:hypothetical protein FRC09_011289 [Ceratobasidium sp. 395]|nr:hypothetical protein FRC09_011289 [Ceratobasidium sp. 395]
MSNAARIVCSPELLTFILEHLTRAQLAPLLRLNQHFHQVGAAVLWRDMDDIEPLLALLPGLQECPSLAIMNPLLAQAAVLSGTKHHYCLYATSVRKIVVPVSVRLLKRWPGLGAAVAFGPLVPLARTVHITCDGALPSSVFRLFVKLLVQDSCQELRFIDQASTGRAEQEPVDIARWLWAVIETQAPLTTLDMFVRRRVLDADYGLAQIRALLPLVRGLERLDISAPLLSTELLLVVGQLKCLAHLTISNSSKAARECRQMHWELPRIGSVLGVLPRDLFPALRSLALKYLGLQCMSHLATVGLPLGSLHVAELLFASDGTTWSDDTPDFLPVLGAQAFSLRELTIELGAFALFPPKPLLPSDIRSIAALDLHRLTVLGTHVGHVGSCDDLAGK